MNIPALPSGLHPEDYDRIEAAVMETVRGRWFLLEYARRQRAIETERLIRAVDRLERYAAGREMVLVAETAEEVETEAPAVDMERARDVAHRARRLAQTLRHAELDENLCAEAEELAVALGELAGEAAEPDGAAADEEAALAGPPALIETRLDDLQSMEPEDGAPPVEIEAASDDVADVCVLEAEPDEATEASEVAVEVLTPAPSVNADPRLNALSRLDQLTLTEKLMLFG